MQQCEWSAILPHSRASCKALRKLVDANITAITLCPKPDLQGPAPLARWPLVTQVDLYLDSWQPVRPADAEQEGEAGAPEAVEVGARAAPEVDPAAALVLAFDGAPLAARQRIDHLRVTSWEPRLLLTPAMVCPLAALLPALRALHLTAHIPRSEDGDGASVEDLHTLYASMATGMPRLEELTLPDAKWLKGVGALAGLKRLAVRPPPYENTAGRLTLARAAEVGKLHALESLELNSVIGLDGHGMDGVAVGAQPLLEVLRSLPAGLQRLHIPVYFYPSFDGFSFSASFSPSVRGSSGINNMRSAKTGLTELHFGGPFAVLALSAMELLREGRLPQQVARLHVSSLHLDPQPLAAEDAERALSRLAQHSASVELAQLHVRVKRGAQGVGPAGAAGGDAVQLEAPAQEQALGFRAVLQAVRLLGAVPRVVRFQGGRRMFALQVDTSALAMTLPRPDHAGAEVAGDAQPQLPDPGVFLHDMVRGLVEEHRGTPLKGDATRRSPAVVLLVQGALVDGLPRNPRGLWARLLELLPPAPAANDGQARTPLSEACMLPPASALLLRLREGVSPEAVAAVLQEAASTQGLDLEVVRVDGVLGCNVSTVLKEASERALQSELDAAAPHLTALPCLEWLYGVVEALRAMPKRVEAVGIY